MRLSGIPIFGQQNSLINVERVNQSVSKQTHIGKSSHRIQMWRDSVTISSQGKTSNIIDTLNKQKANILERRDQFIHQARKQGQSDDMMKSQMEQFDEQIKNIDKQIQEATLKKMTEAAEKSAVKIKSNKPKTKQEIQNDILANITAASTTLDTVETISAEKNKLDGDAGVLKSEIELDRARDTTGSGAEMIAKKEELLAEMQSRSQELLQDIGEGLNETNEILEENTELSTTKPVEDDKEADGVDTKPIEDDKDSDEVATKPSDESTTSDIKSSLNAPSKEEVTQQKDNNSSETQN